ncbi:sugar nucleotide-binding protein [Azospirillum sp. B4]|uniref:SDR family oxidoreductase n=1 Tax=Azospirillum sp. B4 TaxID=95605 RepID=UPI00034D7080|nr:sugar nucleotide-binding protein [Azospirillum sp. B4]
MTAGRILVLGGTGILGQALARRLGPGRCVVTGRTRQAGVVPFNALTDDVEPVIDSAGALDGVFLMMGLTAPDACAARPEEARRLNVDAMRRAVAACEARQLPIVFLSSEVVYNGLQGLYRETDPPAPLMLYGILKLEAEAIVAAARTRAVVARCARVLGSTPGDGTVVTDLLARLRRGETIRVAADQRFSPILDDDAANLLLGLLRSGADGIFHVGGPSALSRLEIAQKCHRWLSEHGLGHPQATVQPALMRDFPTAEARPRDVSLRIDRLTSVVGLVPTGIDGIITACGARLQRPSSPFQ